MYFIHCKHISSLQFITAVENWKVNLLIITYILFINLTSFAAFKGMLCKTFLRVVMNSQEMQQAIRHQTSLFILQDFVMMIDMVQS